MKIAVLLSGGVDSSVALRLLRDQGHDVTAFYLKIWLEDELSYLGDCPWQEDLSYAQAVCQQAGVPLEVISMQETYWQEVVRYTITEVSAGRTPNPDVLCNQRVKFGAFLKAIGPVFEKVASGHYARVEHGVSLSTLHMTPDPIKDQTYFLAHLSQEQLARALFPLGHLTKAEVRSLAQRYDLPNKERKDSQGICFLGKFKFSDFIKHHIGTRVGPIIEFETGKTVGEHEGFWFYTIGQRSGLRLSGGPWYVVAKEPSRNAVMVSRTYYAPDKERDRFTMRDCSWLARVPTTGTYQVKLRHGQQLHEALVTVVGPQGTSAQVQLYNRDQGIAPGQFAVLYSESECLGAGVIDG